MFLLKWHDLFVVVMTVIIDDHWLIRYPVPTSCVSTARVARSIISVALICTFFFTACELLLLVMLSCGDRREGCEGVVRAASERI